MDSTSFDKDWGRTDSNSDSSDNHACEAGNKQAVLVGESVE